MGCSQPDKAEIDAFVARLATAKIVSHRPLFNPYSNGVPANAVRRANLRRYLLHMRAERPLLLLLGEAPGYRGCRLTGVPFTSEQILLQGITELDLFGAQCGYAKTAESPRPVREATATMVWQTLADYQIVPVLWNAFPFHPHRAEQSASNRTPTRSELLQGEPFLRDLLRLFAPQVVVAVGKRAGEALDAWRVPHERVRHPSHGGKRDFVRQLGAIFTDTGWGGTLHSFTTSG